MINNIPIAFISLFLSLASSYVAAEPEPEPEESLTIYGGGRGTVVSYLSPSPLLEQLGHEGAVAQSYFPKLGWLHAMQVGIAPPKGDRQLSRSAESLLTALTPALEQQKIVIVALCAKRWRKPEGAPTFRSCPQHWLRHYDGEWERVDFASLDDWLAGQAESAPSAQAKAYWHVIQGLRWRLRATGRSEKRARDAFAAVFTSVGVSSAREGAEDTSPSLGEAAWSWEVATRQWLSLRGYRPGGFTAADLPYTTAERCLALGDAAPIALSKQPQTTQLNERNALAGRWKYPSK